MFFYTLLYSSFLFFFVLLLFASACVCAVFWVWFLPIYSAENTCSNSAVSFAAFFVRNSSAAVLRSCDKFAGILHGAVSYSCGAFLQYYIPIVFQLFFLFFSFFPKKILDTYMYTLYCPNIKQKKEIP